MIYVFHGSDSFSRSEALKKLKAELDTDGMLSANTNRLDARQATPRDVFAACDTLSMFGGGRLVIVEGALGQAGGRGGGSQPTRPKQAEAATRRSPRWAPAGHAGRSPGQTGLVLE